MDAFQSRIHTHTYTQHLYKLKQHLYNLKQNYKILKVLGGRETKVKNTLYRRWEGFEVFKIGQL